MLPARCLERKLSRAWEQGARSFTECAVCVLCGDARASASCVCITPHEYNHILRCMGISS